MTTRRSVFRLVGTRLFPGGGRGGDLGGMIFPKLLPPGEPTKPFTEHRNYEIQGRLRSDGEKIHSFPKELNARLSTRTGSPVCAICSNKHFARDIFRAS